MSTPNPLPEEPGQLIRVPKDACIYDGLADNSLPTVKMALSCYLGKRVQVLIIEVS